MQPTPRITTRPSVQRRRVLVGCVAVLVVAGGGYALASGSGGDGRAVQPVAPNSGSASPAGTPQREVAVQPQLAAPRAGTKKRSKPAAP